LGTTEEVFFSNWDFEARIEKDNASCQKTYTTFNPITLVENGTPDIDLSRRKDFKNQLARTRSISSGTITRIKK
jgi:hypothetical protein